MESSPLFNHYPTSKEIYDEMYNGKEIRPHYRKLCDFLSTFQTEELSKKEEMARRLFMSQGVTFTVYSGDEGIEKIFLLM